jgi:hypothetical protein
MSNIDKYIDLVYNWKSKLANIPLMDRKVAAAKELGIEVPDCQVPIINYLAKQNHYRFTLLVSREELLQEMIESLQTQKINKGEDKELKTIKLKGEIDMLCGRLVEQIEEAYKTIWGEMSEAAKVEVKKKIVSPEERLRNGELKTIK